MLPKSIKGSSVFINAMQNDLLKILGDKHQVYEFLSTLSLKCSYLLFGKDHVKEIVLEAGVHKSSGNNDLILSCMTILVVGNLIFIGFAYIIY